MSTYLIKNKVLKTSLTSRNQICTFLSIIKNHLENYENDYQEVLVNNFISLIRIRFVYKISVMLINIHSLGFINISHYLCRSTN